MPETVATGAGAAVAAGLTAFGGLGRASLLDHDRLRGDDQAGQPVQLGLTDHAADPDGGSRHDVAGTRRRVPSRPA